MIFPDRFLRACRRQKVDRTPVWFMRQAGRYLSGYRKLREKHSILQLAKTPELACEVTMEPVRLMPIDAAIIFADILLPIEPMGIGLSFNGGPRLDRPIRSPKDVERLHPVDPEESLSFVLKAIRLAKKELRGLPLIGFAGAPFTLASYMIEGGPSKDFVRTKSFMCAEPRAWKKLMLHISDITSRYLKAQIAAGADAVQLFDSWVGALSPDQYRDNVSPYSSRVMKSLSKSGVPVIHFGTGTSGFLEDFGAAGGDMISVDWRIDLKEAFRRLPGRAVQGNLDPALLLAPKKALKSAVSRILAQARGLVFNLGHGILPETPVDNVRSVVEWVHGA
jgi:uroporphyrinogen decarboxylase